MAEATINLTISRSLLSHDGEQQQEFKQDQLLSAGAPIVILGEAGMGKSHLLAWIATHSGYSLCTARQLIIRHDPSTLLGEGNVLVIDALDEVNARKDGDAVDMVLRRLGQLNYPNFVLSCRVADWRSATAIEAMREQYSVEPKVFHLRPLTETDTLAYLSDCIGYGKAREVLYHFNNRGLQGLLGNPQTLQMIAKVATHDHLPVTRSELFERSSVELFNEHRDTKADSLPSREIGLDAAGTALAAIILTGNAAVTRKALANIASDELPMADIESLPGGGSIRSEGDSRFTYWHRRIGEFLGARWLAKMADTPRKRRRLLGLFHSHGVVPANLRGIHAWLARDAELASSVIASDPMGFIEYGDADDLSPAQARALLNALQELASSNPSFFRWGRYSVKGLAQPSLESELKKIISNPNAPVALQVIVLQAVKDSSLIREMEDLLKEIVIATDRPYVCRFAAGDSLAKVLSGEQWNSTFSKLLGSANNECIRLAIELLVHIGYEHFDNDMIVDLVLRYANAETKVVGPLFYLERGLPLELVGGILDLVATKAKALVDTNDTATYGQQVDLADFVYHLVARHIAERNVTPDRLWSWLSLFDAHYGYHQEPRAKIAQYLECHQSYRHAIQRLVILDANDQFDLWWRSVKLGRCEPSLALTEDDVVCLLDALDPSDQQDGRWKEVVLLARHDGEEGKRVRDRATEFAQTSPEDTAWLNGLVNRPEPEWKVEENAHRMKRAEEAAARRDQNRSAVLLKIEEIRRGEWEAIYHLAQVYLAYFTDIDAQVPAHQRIGNWVGDDISEVAYAGFDAYLTSSPSQPTASDVVEGIVTNRYWYAALIVVVALAERYRNGIGFDDVSDDRLTTGLFELKRSAIEQHAGIEGLKACIESELDKRGLLEATARMYFEPQLARAPERILDLHELMRNEANVNYSEKLAADWLESHPNLPIKIESELLACLVRGGQTIKLRSLLASRIDSVDEKRRENWLAAGLLTDFEGTLARIGNENIPSSIVWSLKEYSAELGSKAEGRKPNPAQLEWMITLLRKSWPLAQRPTEFHRGDDRAWDAAEFIIQLIRRLGNDTGDDAIEAIARLRNGALDGYTPEILSVCAEQQKNRAEIDYLAPTLKAIQAILLDKKPACMADLQEVILEELSVVQAKIRSDDAESWQGFFDAAGVPFSEERCRDHLLGLLRQGGHGITLEPETHVGLDGEVDITCSVNQFRMPIEIKGQWHSELWTGADDQLDRFYTQDWRAQRRGVYVVLWFGETSNSNKNLTSAGRGVASPTNASDLHRMLVERSTAAQQGRVRIFVLDIEYRRRS